MFFSGQGYDGANFVADKLGSVKKLIRDTAPRTVYVHYSNHSMDFVPVYACTFQVIQTFF